MQRVQEVVVNPAVDDVHGRFAFGSPDEHPGPADQQVTPFDKLDAHQPGQQRVLIESGAVDARGEHDHGGLVYALGSRGPQRGEQAHRVLRHCRHPLAAKELREHLRHSSPVGQDVADSRRAPQVVLQDTQLALFVADDIDPRDVHAHPVRRHEPVHRSRELRRAGDDSGGDDAVAHDAPFAVDVGEECLQGTDPLRDSRLDESPVRPVQDSRNQVEREDSFLALQVKGDALGPVGACQGLGSLGELIGRQFLQNLKDIRVMGADPAIGARSLVVGRARQAQPGSVVPDERRAFRAAGTIQGRARHSSPPLRVSADAVSVMYRGHISTMNGAGQ